MAEKEITDIREMEYEFDKIQEAYTFMQGRIMEDEVQDGCIEYLAEFRDMDKDVLRETGVFLAEDIAELEFMTAYNDEFMYHLGFRKKSMDYSNRYVFPIKNYQGSLWGWNGYDWESSIKYLVGILGRFSRDKKKKLMYGLEKMDRMFEEDTVIVHEGLFDTLRLRELGIDYGVSLLGKNMSDWHVSVLNRFKNKILIPDGDEAGRDAILSWKEKLDGNVAVIRLKEVERELETPEGDVYTKKAKDTDDRLRGNEEEKERFKDMVEDVRRKLTEHSYIEIEF